MDTKATVGVSYWQAVLGQFPGLLAESRATLEAVTLHNGPGNETFWVKRDTLQREGLPLQLCSPADTSLNLVSRARKLDGSVEFIPLLDFRVPQSKTNQSVAHAVCEHLFDQLDCDGFLIESAHSYHGYGATLLTFREYTQLLGRALLFDPVVDGRHVAHQLISGMGALRIG